MRSLPPLILPQNPCGQGWFVLEYGREGKRLLFWEPADGVRGEDLDLSPEVIPEGSILPRELYDRAAELSARFDLDIRIADQAIRDYTGYDSDRVRGAALQVGYDMMMKLIREDPEAMKHACAVVAEDVKHLVRGLMEESRVDGIFFSVQNAEENRFTYEEYRDWVSPSEKAVLE